MGCKGKRGAEPHKWTEADVLGKLEGCFLKNPVYGWNHIHLFGWESDRVVKTPAGVWHEIEVKVSTDDFRRDFRDKTEKHAVLSGAVQKALVPNHFWYAVPETLTLDVKPLLPPWAGLVSVPRWGEFVRVDVQAPRLHPDHLTDAELDIARKFYFLATTYKARYEGFADERASLKAEAAFVKAEFEAMTGMSWKEYLKDIN